jgi:hypothetical protein
MEKLGVQLSIGNSSVLVKIFSFACDTSLKGILHGVFERLAEHYDIIQFPELFPDFYIYINLHF